MSREIDPLSEPPVCPACGLVLPPGLAASACPRCLLAAGMAGDTEAELETAAMQTPSQAGRSPAATAELTDGAVIDRYRIGRRIGRGGMGEVYAAEQIEPVRRPVAFKVIKRGMDTDHIIARFQTERQALALMDHPNIAVVLDAGATPAGRPYFVMEFVQGVPLTTFCDDKALPLRARLDLFLAVCGAIQHAHQKGIIHRDLKPSNILVSEEAGQPVPKVIDFGLAKATGQDATDRTLLTEAGQVLGTPAYMSPEQAGGTKDLDTRADVYALGAILYELITGEPPFDRRRLESAAWEEILRLIREEEPPRPSARLATTSGTAPTAVSTSRQSTTRGLAREVRGDLDWIVMKALEKERARRYDTVSGLAGDVRHFLAHEPVAARPPTAGYRLGKFVRRHRRSLATAAVITTGLLSTAGVWAKSEWEKRQRASQLSQQVLGLVAEAERLMQENDRVDYDNEEPFRRALELSERAQALLGRETPDPAVAERLGPLLAAVGQEDEARRLIGELEEASIAGLSEDQKKSLSRYQQALSARAIEPGRSPVEPITARWAGHREAVRSRLAGELERWAGLLPPEADPQSSTRNWLRQLVDTIDADDAWRNQVRTAARDGDREALVKLAGSPERKRQPVVVVVQMCRDLTSNGEPALSTSICREIEQANPSSFWAHVALGITLQEAPGKRDGSSLGQPGRLFLTPHSLGSGQLRRSEHDESIGHLTAAVALRPRSSGAWINMVNELMYAGRLEEALAAGRKAIDCDPDSALAHVQLGLSLDAKGDLDGAIAAFRRAIELKPDWAVAHTDLGSSLCAKGDLDGAIASDRRAIELDQNFASPYVNLGVALRLKGDLDGAIAALGKAIELDPDVANAHGSLSDTLRAKGDLDAAIAEARRAVELKPDFAGAHRSLGMGLQAKGDLDGAIAAYRKAIELKPDHSSTHAHLGEALHAKGDLHGAIAAYRKAIDSKPDSAEAHINLGVVLRATGDLDGAIASYRKAIDSKPDFAEAHTNLGVVLRATGDLDGAIASYRKAIDSKPDWAQAHLNLAIALEAKDDMEGAIAALRKAIELQPDLAGAHYLLGGALGANGKRDEAIVEFRRAIELKPDHAEAHVNLGNALSGRDDLDGAIASYRTAIDLKPDLFEAHLNLGEALRARGDLDGAIASYRTGIDLKPDSVEGQARLGRALAWAGSFPAAVNSFERALAIDQNERRTETTAGFINLMKNLMQQEAAVLAKLNGAVASGKRPAPANHAPAIDAIYEGVSFAQPPKESNPRGYAETHRDKLAGAFERATIQMITVRKAGRDGIGELATEVRRKAMGGADFGELASSYSADSFASEGGRREITRMSLKKLLSDAAFALKPGELSSVIEDEGNFYLIRMVERQAADAKTIDLDDPAVRSAVAALIEAERREAWKERFWRQCVEKAGAARR